MKDGGLSRRVDASDLMSPDKAPELFQFLDIGTRITGRLEYSAGRINLVWPKGTAYCSGGGSGCRRPCRG